MAGASTSFTVHVDCPGTAYDQDVALNEGNGWVNVTGNIPTGLECTISEPTVPAGWNLGGIEPETVTVTEGTPEEVQVTVTNVRELGKIRIEKVLEGPVAGASTSFTVHVDCPGTAYDQDVALNEGNGWVNVTGYIPTGLECTISEPTVPRAGTWVASSRRRSRSPRAPRKRCRSRSINVRELGKIRIEKVPRSVAGASTSLRCTWTARGRRTTRTWL